MGVGAQRLLGIQSLDRLGAHGRGDLLSLASLDGHFVSSANAPWPVVTSELGRQKVIASPAHDAAAFLYAFGTLIGNTDMHSESQG